MPLRPPAGFIRPGYDPLKVPDAPTIGTATAGDAQASVAFTAPSNVGGSAISAYYAVSNPGQITASGASSPVTVTGLTNGTSYTFTVWALNTYGPSPYSAASGSVSPAVARGLFGGGQSSVALLNKIEYITISTTGNATDFGDLNAAYDATAASSSTRGLFARSGSTSSIVYVTIATTGNSTTFGNLSQARLDSRGCGNNTLALFGGGADPANSATAYNTIDYVTIATTGNATDFGDLTVARRSAGAFSSSTRAIWSGGVLGNTPYTNVIDYVTIATTGNATDFGDLTTETGLLTGCSSSTRGLSAGGFTSGRVNTIEYVTIATTGNATDFGDLTIARYGVSGCSSNTRGVFGGGNSSSGVTNVIDYVTINTTGNATDFGDMTIETSSSGACSSGHGGL